MSVEGALSATQVFKDQNLFVQNVSGSEEKAVFSNSSAMEWFFFYGDNMTDIVCQTSHACILIASGPRKKLKIVFALIDPPINLSA